MPEFDIHDKYFVITVNVFFYKLELIEIILSNDLHGEVSGFFISH